MSRKKRASQYPTGITQLPVAVQPYRDFIDIPSSLLFARKKQTFFEDVDFFHGLFKFNWKIPDWIEFVHTFHYINLISLQPPTVPPQHLFVAPRGPPPLNLGRFVFPVLLPRLIAFHPNFWSPNVVWRFPASATRSISGPPSVRWLHPYRTGHRLDAPCPPVGHHCCVERYNEHPKRPGFCDPYRNPRIFGSKVVVYIKEVLWIWFSLVKWGVVPKQSNLECKQYIVI